MDTKRGEMSEYHSQSEDEATISSILGTVFSVEKEETIPMVSERPDEEAIPMVFERPDEEAIPMVSERPNEEAITMVSERSNKEAVTMLSERPNEEGITVFSAKLDEEAFEPLVEQGETPSIPTEEELVKYPELEYSSREVQAIVNQMDKAQKQEFREYEQYFLTRYRQTSNIQPLYLEIRNIVKEMCPSMPGQMQDAVVEARAQILAKTKLKELCKQLGVLAPRYEPPPMVHPMDEGILGEEAVPISSTSRTVRRVVPALVTTEIKKDIKPQVQLRLLSDTMLDALGSGDEDCMVMRIKRG